MAGNSYRLVRRQIGSVPWCQYRQIYFLSPNRAFATGVSDCKGTPSVWPIYGGWWQQISSQLRNSIHINGVPTVEVDFKGMHVNILSLEKGVKLEGDPYELKDILLEGVNQQEQRGYLKTLILTAINAAGERATYQAFRDSYSTGDPARSFKNKDLKRLLDAFLKQTPQLEGALFNDQGIRLMNVDARIAEDVLRSTVAHNLPVLCVHDSFIVDYRRTKLLKLFMAAGSKRVVGHVLPIASDWMGLDEVPEDRREEFVEVRRKPPCRGAEERRKLFEAAVGPITED